ncbi:MAG TPA: sialidase family protein [Terriglobia bacterium]|nr:sialidase family protein [Terriglobia bacterium]
MWTSPYLRLRQNILWVEVLLVVALIVPGAKVLRAGVRSEFIFEKAPFDECHASTIVETGEGDYLAAWFGGRREGAKDVAIWMARRSQSRWSAPVVVAREPGIPTWNPVLFRGDNRIWLFYKFGPSPQTWTGAYRISDDDGQSWSPPVRLPAGLLGPIKNKPIRLANGDIVAGSSVESYQAWAGWVERSSDSGKTWTKHGPIAIPGEPFGLIQPTLIELTNQRLRLFARTRQGFIFTADSSDSGRTWSPARPTTLPNPNCGIDAVRLRDGRILLVYNHSTRERTPLNVALSADGGETWTPFLELETAPGEYSYPAVIQSADGDVHITYTWKRRNIKHVIIPKSSLK